MSHAGRGRLAALALIGLTGARAVQGQAHAIDSAVFGGDTQRSGWEKSDTRITRENAKDLEFVYRRSLNDVSAGAYGLTPPVILGLLISYRGFKELAFVDDASGNVWAIDADLNRLFWKRELNSAGVKKETGVCGQMAPAMPGLVPPVNFGGSRPANEKRRPTLPGNGFGQPRPVFALASDGKLHKLNTSNGEDMSAPLDFLPAGAKASPLTIHDGTIYATTRGGCGNAPSGIFAVDLTAPVPAAISVVWKDKHAPPFGTPAFGTDGTVYVATGSGETKEAAGQFANSLLAFAPNDLTPKARFTEAATSRTAKTGAILSVSTPVVFREQERDLIVSVGEDGRLLLHDAPALGGPDHATALYRTPPLLAGATGKTHVGGGLSTWRDAAGTRWVAAPVWGPLNPELPFKKNGEVSHGAIVAFHLEKQDQKLQLTPGWCSRDMISPVAPVSTGGVVFALSTGIVPGTHGNGGNGHAVLYALDGTTGEELYSSGDKVTEPGELTGLTLANGRLFFTTTKNTLYAFGIHLEI